MTKRAGNIPRWWPTQAVGALHYLTLTVSHMHCQQRHTAFLSLGLEFSPWILTRNPVRDDGHHLDVQDKSL